MTLGCVPLQVTEVRTQQPTVAAQQQESISQVIQHLQGAVASALATAQVTVIASDCV